MLDDNQFEVGVKMGTLSVSDSADSAISTFVGSCVALCMYDPVTRIGGMAHIMLPDSGGRVIANGSEAKYADHAIRTMLQKMTSLGARRERIVSKIVGGAKMFSNENAGDSLFNIGERNCSSVKSLLERMNIPLLGEKTGAHNGRWVKLELATGNVTVSDRSGETVI
jgi:chemotaxis protein CheD